MDEKVKMRKCFFKSNKFWIGVIFLFGLFFLTRELIRKNKKPSYKVFMIERKMFGGERGIDKNEWDPEVLKLESEFELLKKKINMYKTTKKPVTKQPKLLNAKYNSEKIKKMTSDCFKESLKKYSDNQKRIILSIGDQEYFNLALNFYRLSILKHNIKNFLFISLDDETSARFSKLSIPFCNFPLALLLVKSFKPSNFGTMNYYYKTNMKTAVMIQALFLGFQVLMVDVDVIILKEPLSSLPSSNLSLLIQMDRSMMNTGFVFAKPTKYSKTIYEHTWNLFLKFQRSHDQSYFNRAVNLYKENDPVEDIFFLSKSRFPCGLYYFEEVHRPFRNEPRCEDCVILHNNYLGSVAAKLYRFKESLLWTVDENQYYSSQTTKYMTYYNPFLFKTLHTREVEVESLKNALIISKSLNRVLVLPSFHCCKCSSRMECSHPRYKCSLLSLLRVSTFHSQFESLYREHVFFNNSLVPKQVVNSFSPLLLLNTPFYREHNLDSNAIRLPNEVTSKLSIEEIKYLLEPFKNYSVLHFHSLYGLKLFEKEEEESLKKYQMSQAFQCSEYEQWEKNSLQF